MAGERAGEAPAAGDYLIPHCICSGTFFNDSSRKDRTNNRDSTENS